MSFSGTCRLDNNTYYNLLGVGERASLQEITQAYKRKALQFHPDKAVQNNLSIEKATQVFQNINNAYQTLKDPILRRDYDATLKPTSLEDFSWIFRQEHTTFYQKKSSFRQPDVTSTIRPEKLNQELHAIVEKDSVIDLDEYVSKHGPNLTLLGSIIYIACQMGKCNIVRFLIEKKHVSPELKIDNNLAFTGAIFKAAAMGGSLELVTYLLETHGVDIEAQGLSPGTMSSALSKAAEKGHLSVVKYLLLKGAKVNPEVAYSDILKRAIESGSLPVVKLLVDAGSTLDRFHLVTALRKGYLPIAQYILQLMPGLHTHAFYSNSFACETIRGGNVELLKYLIQNESLDLFYKQFSFYSLDMVLDNLLLALGESRSVEMTRFLLQEEKIIEKYSNIQSREKGKSIVMTGVVKCSFDNNEVSRLERVQLLAFLVEEMQLLPEKQELERVIANEMQHSDIECNAYLQSYLFEEGETKKLLRLIAMKGLKGVSITQLFYLFTKELLKKGSLQTFNDTLHQHINERKLCLEELKTLCTGDLSFRQQAFFYYLEYYHEEDLTKLKFLVEEMGADIHDVHTHQGISPVQYAMYSGGYNAIVKYLIARGADTHTKGRDGKSIDDILQDRRKYCMG